MKIKRHSKILELIRTFDIERQEDLAEKLKESGFLVTQATVSRDVRELELTKSLAKSGIYRYIASAPSEAHISDRYSKIFKNSVISLDIAQNLVVIKTIIGAASAVAVALDAMKLEESVGTLAGDDIIFCATKSNEQALELLEKLKTTIDM